MAERCCAPLRIKARPFRALQEAEAFSKTEGDVLALEPADFPYLLLRTLEVGGDGDQLEEAVRAQFGFGQERTASRAQPRPTGWMQRQRPLRRVPSNIADARAALDERPNLVKARLRCVATVRGDNRSWSAI